MAKGNTYTLKNPVNCFERVNCVMAGGVSQFQYAVLSGFETTDNIINEFKQCEKITVNLDAIVKNNFGVSVEASYVFSLKDNSCFDSQSCANFVVNEETSTVFMKNLTIDRPK